MKVSKELKGVNISKFSQAGTIENSKPYVRQSLYRIPI